MIETIALEKHTRHVAVLEEVSFVARSGRITALVGGAGAGKSTVLRILMGLDRPTHGRALIGGRSFGELRRPMASVGAALDHRWVYRHRSARTHLRWLALSGGIGQSRVEVVLDLMDILFAADRRISTFSDGMLLRLAVAGALLGDPEVVVVDRLFDDYQAADVAGVVHILAHLASEGRTVLVTARAPRDVVLFADDMVILDSGRVIGRCTADEFIALSGGVYLRVRSPQVWKLEEALRGGGVETSWEADPRLGGVAAQSPTLVVPAVERKRAGMIVARHEVSLSEVAPSGQAFDELITHMIRDRGKPRSRVAASQISGTE